MGILQKIFDVKRAEVEAARVGTPLRELQAQLNDAPPVRPFKDALQNSPHPLALIAEVKKASPSKGVIRTNFDPAAIARDYAAAGADCLSVLTDVNYFQGAPEYLQIARAESGLPCLRKDFICDPYQVYEARVWGADCILLIVAGLQDSVLRQLYELSKELGMDVLVEVHTENECERAVEMGADLIGVNNRDLGDMTTSVSKSEELLPLIGSASVKVSESALESNADLNRVAAAGARAVLIGTTFCAAPDIWGKVTEVMGW